MLIKADEARSIAAQAKPGRDVAQADTLAASALRWAMKNTIGQTESRIQTYAKYGKTQVTVKFAPGEGDRDGVGNAFYNDLLANSNGDVADAMTDIIYGREQSVISPLQTARLLNEYSAKLAHFVQTLTRMGYGVSTGEVSSAQAVNAHHDDSTIIVSWA